MEERMLEKNTEMLHLFEKMKFTVGLANKMYRKDMHYGFNLWREQCRAERKVANVLETVFCKVIPNQLKRVYFGRWSQIATVLKRVEIAGMLLTEYENTKYKCNYS